MTSAAGWSAGYVTDVAYTRGYYPQQSPIHLAMNATLVGVEADWPSPTDALNYLELGCGQGFGALVLAAANPSWNITAIDFNPAHIAQAQRLAAGLGLDNVRFLEADLATLADSPLLAEIPAADVTSAHGVWSWVAPDVRAGIVRLLAARVRPGGLVHISYNSLPTWHGGLLLQRLIHRTGRYLAHGSIAQAEAGLGVVRALAATGARGLAQPGMVKDLLERLETSPAAYLAHEYMNDQWSPCWQEDVAADLAGAKLDYVASAQTLTNFPEMIANAEQRAILERFSDPVIRELILDSCQERGLRHDIFARGLRRLSVGARDAALEALTLALPIAPESFVYALTVPAGQATLNEEYYRPLIARLAEGPATVGELLSLDVVAGHKRNPAEVVGAMVGSNQAVILPRPGAPINDACRRLNAASLAQLRAGPHTNAPSAVACPALGGGMPLRRIQFEIADRLAATNGADPAAIDTGAWARDVAPPDATAAQVEQIAQEIAAVLREHGKLWRWLGVA